MEKKQQETKKKSFWDLDYRIMQDKLDRRLDQIEIKQDFEQYE